MNSSVPEAVGKDSGGGTVSPGVLLSGRSSGGRSRGRLDWLVGVPILQNELTRLAALVARWQRQKTKGRRHRAKGKRTKAKSLTSPRYTETREAVPDVGRVPVTAGRAGVLWYVVPRPAPQDTVPSGTGRHLRVRSTRQLAKSHIFTPLPNVPVHVVKAEWIR